MLRSSVELAASLPRNRAGLRAARHRISGAGPCRLREFTGLRSAGGPRRLSGPPLRAVAELRAGRLVAPFARTASGCPTTLAWRDLPAGHLIRELPRAVMEGGGGTRRLGGTLPRCRVHARRIPRRFGRSIRQGGTLLRKLAGLPS
ncbi:hypothetical protein [Nocardia neocaledoniensis]|uniref:hypothetical protein n=1 Tax=Nocardia neocaledoniensis TaxID=236511 RepID=UPI002454EAD1|nr:hypothetical protein [Nocardia neocaledoniensis]